MSSGWRPALRMARREIRRAPGRSLFTWLMIFVPVTAICALLVVVMSDRLSDSEYLDLQLGPAQAMLTQTGEGFDPVYTMGGQTTNGGETRDAKPVPAWGTTVEQQRDATAALLGRTVVAITRSSYTLAGNESVGVDVRGVDFADLKAASFVQELRGRVPRDGTEALVSARGLAAGVPASGQVTLAGTNGPLTFTIVGTAESYDNGPVSLITLPEAQPDQVLFFVFGGAPIGWDEAVRLAGYGFEVTSHELLAHPPAAGHEGNSAAMEFMVISLLTAAALLEVALMVGPAFAIGAARQRRGLALAATNGATLGQLRKAAIGQAVILGATAAVLGTGVGTITGVLVYTWMASDRTHSNGPLEVPFGQLAMVLLLGALTAIGSALVTSRGLGKLDLVSALRGSVRPAPPRRGAPLVGGLLVAAGIAGVWSVLALDDNVRWWVWMGSAAAVLAGAILGVPGLLRLTARLAGRAPIPARMALRDTARQHGRATSTVAAVMAGSLILATVWTFVASTDTDSARHYTPAQPMGQASLSLTTTSADVAASTKAAALGVDPRLRVAVLSSPDSSGGPEDGTGGRPFAAIRSGCTAAQATGSGEGEVDETRPVVARCMSLGSGFRGSGIVSGTVDDLTTAFSLDAGQRQALSDGRLLAVTEAPPDTTAVGVGPDEWARTDIVDGAVRFVTSAEKPKAYSVPAQALPASVLERGAVRFRYGAIISTAAAQKLGWHVDGAWVQLADPAGPISPELEARLTDALAPWLNDQTYFGVERGPKPSPQPVLMGATGTLILLLLVAAVTATVLSTSELRPFLGTFVAVGASPGLSRRLAGTQGALLTGLGCAIGVTTGCLIGAPLAMFSTGGASSGPEVSLPPVVTLPWLLIAALVVATPAVAGLTAALCTPSRTTLAKRS